MAQWDRVPGNFVWGKRVGNDGQTKSFTNGFSFSPVSFKSSSMSMLEPSGDPSLAIPSSASICSSGLCNCTAAEFWSTNRSTVKFPSFCRRARSQRSRYGPGGRESNRQRVRESGSWIGYTDSQNFDQTTPTKGILELSNALSGGFRSYNESSTVSRGIRVSGIAVWLLPTNSWPANKIGKSIFSGKPARKCWSIGMQSAVEGRDEEMLRSIQAPKVRLAILGQNLVPIVVTPTLAT